MTRRSGRETALGVARWLWWQAGARRATEAVLARAPARVRAAVERRKLALRVRLGDRLVPERKLTDAYVEALTLLRARRGGDLGDYLEFGVYIGTSLLCMQRACERLGLDRVRLFGFDSFAGLPEADDPELGDVFQPGGYRSDLDFTRRHLEENGVDWSRVTLVPGWFEETLTAQTRETLGLRRASVIMVDCDIYSSTRQSLAFCEPLIGDEAVVFFDDWHTADLAAQGQGERRAFEEFLAEHPELVVERELPAYGPTAVVLHVRRVGARAEEGA